MKVDRQLEAFAVAKVPRRVFDPLDLGVETFGDRIGDAMRQVGQNISPDGGAASARDSASGQGGACDSRNTQWNPRRLARQRTTRYAPQATPTARPCRITASANGKQEHRWQHGRGKQSWHHAFNRQEKGSLPEFRVACKCVPRPIRSCDREAP